MELPRCDTFALTFVLQLSSFCRDLQLWTKIEPILMHAGFSIEVISTAYAGHAVDVGREFDCTSVEGVMFIRFGIAFARSACAIAGVSYRSLLQISAGSV